MSKQTSLAQRLMRYPAIETHLLQAEHVDQVFRVQVMLPAVNPVEATRFPVVYMPDANAYFDACKAIAYSAQLSAAEFPRFILVGIGYPGDSPCTGVILRARDLTFPGYPSLDLTPPPLEGVLTVPAGQTDYRGGESFLDFIEAELIPFIDARYPTHHAERTYFGHSAGGGLGLFALAERTGLFDHYMISSPGVIFHGRSSAGECYDRHDVVCHRLEKLIASASSLANKRVYVSAGSEEEFEPELQQWALTSSLDSLAATLAQARPLGLHLVSEILPRETHATAWPVAFIHGLRAVFNPALRRTSP